MSASVPYSSSWFCLRCGRAGYVEHSVRDTDALLEHIVLGEHASRVSGIRRGSAKPCPTDIRVIRIARGERDFTALCASIRSGERGEREEPHA